MRRRNEKLMDDPLQINSTHLDNLYEMKTGNIFLHEHDLRTMIKYHGCHSDNRILIWMYLLKIIPITTSPKERKILLEQLKKEYELKRDHWLSLTEENVNEMEETLQKRYHRNKTQIIKDVNRTDRDTELFKDHESETTKKLYNVLITIGMSEIEYSQGMNELAATIFHATQEEYVVYYLYLNILKMMENVYGTNGYLAIEKMENIGTVLKIVDQEYYDYMVRHKVSYNFVVGWILTLYRREFEIDEILRLWDSIIAFPEDKFYMFISVAILIVNKYEIIDNRFGYDDMFIWSGEMKNKIPLDIIFDADNIMNQFKLQANDEEKKCIFDL